MGKQLTPEQKRKTEVMKAFFKKSEAPKPKDVKCKKHGKTPSVSWNVHDVAKITVCFMCLGEKQTEGLKNFAK